MIEKLVKKAQKGDTEAFGKLIIILQEDLYKIARSRLKQEADIQDAVQDTIVTAFQTIKTLSKISAFKTWIIKILINKCNDMYARKGSKDISLKKMNSKIIFQTIHKIILV